MNHICHFIITGAATLCALSPALAAQAVKPPVATVAEVKGTVFISSAENGAFIKTFKGMPLGADQKIAPLSGAQIHIALKGATLHIPAQTEVLLGGYGLDDAGKPVGYGLRLLRGFVKVTVDKTAPAHTNIAVNTPVGLAHLSPKAGEPTTFIVEVRPEGTTAASINGCCAKLATQGGAIELAGEHRLSLATSRLAPPAAPVTTPPEWLAEIAKTLE